MSAHSHVKRAGRNVCSALFPQMFFHINPSIGQKGNSFPAQKFSLDGLIAENRIGRESTGAIDDAVIRQLKSVRRAAQRETNITSSRGTSSQSSNLSVGRYTSARNFGNEPVNLLKKAAG